MLPQESQHTPSPYMPVYKRLHVTSSLFSKTFLATPLGDNVNSRLMKFKCFNKLHMMSMPNHLKNDDSSCNDGTLILLK